MPGKTTKKSPKVAKTSADKKGAAKRAERPARAAGSQSASDLIDQRIAEITDWRGETLARMRALIREAVPEIVEEVKWRGTPVWSDHGIICTGETYKNVVKLTFAKGASLPDPSHLFNASLEGNTRRAIDIREGETVNARAFKALIKAAVAHNRPTGKVAAASGKSAAPSRSKKVAAGQGMATSSKSSGPAKPKLLSGGNPQIAKGDGDAPVQQYIAAMPGWKSDVGRRLDAIIVRTVPNVRKAVKWNSPFYGAGDEDQGWFVSFHCFTKYIKVTFFRGNALRPVPAGKSKYEEVRYLDIYEDQLDEAQFADWVKQASQLPGERL